MKLFQGMAASVSALTAEKLRLDVIAHNVANINTTRGNDGQPFRKKMVFFREVVDQSLSIKKETRTGLGVRVAGIVDDLKNPLRPVYDPTHPDADGEGIVWYPNVDLTTELIDMINAQRSYQINMGVFNTSREMAEKALELGRG